MCGIGWGFGIYIFYFFIGFDWIVFDFIYRVWFYNDLKVVKSKKSLFGIYEES